MPVTLACCALRWSAAVALLQTPVLPPGAGSPRDTLRIYAVGDINLGRRAARDRLVQGDTLFSFRPLVDTLHRADILFGNLESPIVHDAQPVDTLPDRFLGPRLAAEALRRAGFDIVSTANNHAWDGEGTALIETMRRLSRAGVRFVGSGIGRQMAQQPVILERSGWRVAFFAVTRAWNPAPYAFHAHAGSDFVAWGDPAWMHPAIQRLKAGGRVDLIIVSVHGGTEYLDEPPAHHREFLEGLVTAGADVVLAHHPHVLQAVRMHLGKPIAQSLGNFVFLQAKPWTALSAILRIVVAPDGSVQVSAVPVRAGFQPQLLSGSAADSVRSRLGVPLATDPMAIP